MIKIKLNNTHLGAKIKTDEGQDGTVKAYNNVTQVVFAFIEGKMVKYPYNEVTII